MNRLWSIGICLLVLVGGCVDLAELLEEIDVTSPAEYTGTVYLIGQLNGNLEDELHDIIEFVPYDNISTDAPIVMAGDTVAELTAEQITGLTGAFEARMPLILVQADDEEIMALHQAIGDDDFQFALPYGVEYAEIYAIDREADGSIWQWVTYPPQTDEDDTDTDARQDARAEFFLNWLQIDGERMADADAAEADANAKSISGASNNDLTQLAAAFVSQNNFSRYGNTYQIVHYIYGCHSVDTGDDWFYVQQQCVFSGKGAYGGAHRDGCSEVKGKYMDKIEIDSWMKGYANNFAMVGLMQSSPETINNTESVTSGVDFNIGGEVKYDKDGWGGSVSAGVTISNSRTVNVRDCEVTNNSNDRGNNAHWTYDFKRCRAIGFWTSAQASDPPTLATSTFQPLNQWIWRMDSTMRTKNVPLHVKLDVTLCSTWAVYCFGRTARSEQYPCDGGEWEYDVSIPYPAISD